MNNVATKVHLRVDLARSALPRDVIERLVAIDGVQVARASNELLLHCDETRSQASAPARPTRAAERARVHARPGTRPSASAAAGAQHHARVRAAPEAG